MSQVATRCYQLERSEPSGNRKHLLFVISGKSETNDNTLAFFPSSTPIVTQLRLAEIQELQSRIAFDTATLERMWAALREDMSKGYLVAKGPIRAWITKRSTIQNKKMKIRTTLHVR